MTAEGKIPALDLVLTVKGEGVNLSRQATLAANAIVDGGDYQQYWYDSRVPNEITIGFLKADVKRS